MSVRKRTWKTAAGEERQAWIVDYDAVHKAGGLIFLQLWHVGRISHPSL